MNVVIQGDGEYVQTVVQHDKDSNTTTVTIMLTEKLKTLLKCLEIMLDDDNKTTL